MKFHGEASRISVVENSSVTPEKFWCQGNLTVFGVLRVLSGTDLRTSGCPAWGGEDNQVGERGVFSRGMSQVMCFWTNVFFVCVCIPGSEANKVC